MKIRKLRLSGFKSFVEPAELLIEPGLTGVVGPNGCGKSNLLEAIRWVMGESSPKSMRGGGMEDVIFAGTATRASRDFAEVTILTESSGEGGPEEIEVVRRIERGAGSAYRINGRDVRARDVSLMFADAATGAHSPALVSQGRIAAIIAAKPAERRQMLEEAAGIAGLHVRRREAEQRLRATEANLARLDDLLGDMEVRANALRRQARAAERYRALSADIRIAEARALFARWREAATAADLAERQAKAAEEAVRAAGEAQRAAAAHQSAAISGLATLRAAAEAARETASALGHRLAALRAEHAGVQRRLAELESQRDALARDRAREDTLAIDASEALARLATEDKALSGALAEAEARRPALDADVADAERAARDGEVAMARALAAQAVEQADIRVAQAALGQTRQRLDRAHAECARLDRELAAIGADEPLMLALEQARAAHSAADSAISDANSNQMAAEARREGATAARDSAETAGAAARATFAALESEARALAKGLESGGSRALSRMRAAPGFERALAAALGDDLDAPIGGEGPRSWAGSLHNRNDPQLSPSLTPLNEHVTCPPELARRLAQIGVVDRDDDVELAVGQRLVTRDGKLRRWDGYVARDVGAAAAERLIRANRLAELELALPPARAAVESAAAALAAASTTLAEARIAIDAARRAGSDAEAALRKAMRDEDAAAAAIERRAATRASLAERRSRADAERIEAETAALQAQAMLAALPDGEATRREVDRLRTANDASRATLAEARARVAALSQTIEADGRRLHSARADAKGWRARAGDAARRIDEMAKRAAAVEQELASLTDTPTTLAGQLAGLEQETQAADAAALLARDAEREAEATLRRTEQALSEAGEALATARETRAGAIARHENEEGRRRDLGRMSGERFECPAPVLPEKLGFPSAEVAEAATEAARHDRLMGERERIGPVNLIAETELRELEEGRATSQAEREELGLAIHRLRGSIGNLNREGRARLLAAFEAVDGHFRVLFGTLFAGGEAHLALIDSDDPLEAGLEIMAQPPGKKLSALTLLSGGEQALTAVALIFALFLTNPAPICVLDEVDAPLDDANIERFCDLLDRMARETDTRYLIVTHNSVTMSRMHRLFGVTMIERGISRLVSVDLGGAETLLAAE